MLDRIIASLDTIVLGESAVVNGVRVRRASLLGFQVGSGDELLEAHQAARRIAGLAKARSVRVALCGRCGGDGLGRRNRGACGLCRGPGIQVSEPPLGWHEASPADVAAAAAQARAALAEARYPQARSSLLALLRELEPAAPLRSSA